MYDQKTMTTYVSWSTGILKSLPRFMHFYANNYFFLFFFSIGLLYSITLRLTKNIIDNEILDHHCKSIHIIQLLF